MRMSLHFDYAMRLLMQLAVNEDRLCTIADVAKTYGISKNHLMKVAHLLVKEGVIASIRGRSGGLRLALPPDEITVGDILRITEGDIALLDCLQARPDSACHVVNVCALKQVLKEAKRQFLAVLDDCTLADAVSNRKPLAALLRFPNVVDVGRA